MSKVNGLQNDYSKYFQEFLKFASYSCNLGERNSLSADSIPLDKLIEWAKSNRLLKPIYQVVKNEQLEMDKELESQFLDLVKKQQFKAMTLVRELALLDVIFEKNQIPYLSIKGPAFGQLIYGDFDTKNSRDLDILVDQSKLLEVCHLLIKNGFKLLAGFLTYNNKQQQAFIKEENQLLFMHEERKIMVEVHWRLFANQYLLPLEFDSLYKERQEVKLANRLIPCPSNEVVFVYLCCHGGKHAWEMLYWLHEITTLLQKKEWLKMNTVLELIKAHKLERIVALAVDLSEDLLNLRTPKDLKSVSNSVDVEELKEACISRIKQVGVESSSDFSTNILKLKFKMKLKSGLRYKINNLKLHSRNDYKLVKLPESLFFLYFWLRPFFWIRRYLSPKP
jgi:hypothetical protein